MSRSRKSRRTACLDPRRRDCRAVKGAAGNERGFSDVFRRFCAQLQNRPDWPKHFTYAAWIASGAGLKAAYKMAEAKERGDAFRPDNAYDLDDLAISYYGAQWAELARINQWVAAALAAPARQQTERQVAASLYVVIQGRRP